MKHGTLVASSIVRSGSMRLPSVDDDWWRSSRRNGGMSACASRGDGVLLVEPSDAWGSMN